MTNPNFNLSSKFSFPPAPIYTVNAKSIIINLVLISWRKEVGRVNFYVT